MKASAPSDPLESGAMLPERPLPGWTEAARTATATLYRDPSRPRCVYVWADAGLRSELEDAEINERAIQAVLEEEGQPGAVFVFLDRFHGISREARLRHFRGTSTTACVALVGGTPLSRALASFTLGVFRPVMPVRLFGDLAEAEAWAQEHLQP